MADRIKVPVKSVNGELWAQLNHFGPSHLICGEEFKRKDDNYSLAGGHRVRLFSVKYNVHWKVPAGTPLDVSGVQPASEPPRRKPNQ